MNIPLHELKPGQRAQVVELNSLDVGRLERLSAYGLGPGSWVQLRQTQPVLIFKVDQTEIGLDFEVAAEILVSDAA